MKINRAVIPVLILGLLALTCSCGTNSGAVDIGETFPLQINLQGVTGEYLINSQGKVQSDVLISSAGDEITLSCDRNTILLDRDDDPVQTLEAAVNSNPPSPDTDAVMLGNAWEFLPSGATFEPSLTLTMRFSGFSLPEGVDEDDLYVAYYDGEKWVPLRYKDIDNDAGTLTTRLFHLTTFAMFGSTAPEPPDPTTQPASPQVDRLAPDFQLENLNGDMVQLNALRGRPVLLNFWATWCNPCRYEMPFLQALYEETRDDENGLVILAVDTRENRSKVEQFISEAGFTFPVLLDTDAQVSTLYRIRAFPTTFFINKDGIIEVVKVGAFMDESELQQNVEKILP